MSGALQAVLQNLRSFSTTWFTRVTPSYPSAVDGGSGGIAVDSSSNIYFGGYGSFTNSGYNSLFSIANTGATINWAKFYLKSGSSAGAGLWAVYINTAATQLWASVIGDDEIYWFKFDLTTGALISQLRETTLSGTAYGGPMTEDSSGNQYLTGTAVVSPRRSGVVKFNSSDVAQWGYSFYNTTNYKGSYDSTRFNDILVDSSGNVYLAGEMSSQSFAGYGMVPGIIKLSSAGATTWARGLGTEADTGNAYKIIINSSGNLLVAYYMPANAGLFFSELDPATGLYNGLKKVVDTSTNTSATQNARITYNATASVFYFAYTNATSGKIDIVKVDQGLTTATACAIAFTGASGVFPITITSDNSFIYFLYRFDNTTTEVQEYYTLRLSTTMSANVGLSGSWTGGSFVISAATGRIATHAKTLNPSLTLTKTSQFATWTTGGMSASTPATTITKTSI